MKKVLVSLVAVVVVAFVIAHMSASSSPTNQATNPMQEDTFMGCRALDGMFIDIANHQTPKMNTTENAINFGMKSPNFYVSLAAGTMKWAMEFTRGGVGGGKIWTRALTSYARACHALHIGPGGP